MTCLNKAHITVNYFVLYNVLESISFFYSTDLLTTDNVEITWPAKHNVKQEYTINYTINEFD